MSFDFKLGSEFLRVPKLPADGKGFVVWKARLELSVWARGLHGHLDGTTKKPLDPPKRDKDSELTPEQVSSDEKSIKDSNQYLQEQAIVFQQIVSTIPDSLYLKIKGKPTVHDIRKKKNDRYFRCSISTSGRLWLCSIAQIVGVDSCS